MNSSPYYVTLKRLIDEIGLTEYYMPVDPEEVHITKTDVLNPRRTKSRESISSPSSARSRRRS